MAFMHRSIRPKPPGASTKDEPEESVQHSQPIITSPDAVPPKLKRQQTHIACNSCRSARAKCDGKRPCGRCVARSVLDCYYEVHEGETRMSSLRKRVSGLEEEVAFLRELIDTGWDTSQEQLRLRVRHGRPPSNRDDTPQTQSVTTASDVNTPEDGEDSSTKGRKRRAESSNTATLPLADNGSKSAASSSTDVRMIPRPQMDGQLPENRISSPYASRDSYHPHSHHVSDPFQWFNFHGRSPVPPPISLTTELLPQLFFEQLCALLDTGQTLPSLSSGFAERLDDHIAILANSKGWTEVIRTVALDPQWQVLRQIDEFLGFMRPIDRLATLRLMRLQMKGFAAAGSSVEAEHIQTSLPEWAKPTAIQRVRNHPSIVRYIAWPMMRNYLLTHPSLISAPVFSAIWSCTRFVFPESINPVTETSVGMLELVPEFERSLRNLNSWTLTREFVDRYPVFDRAVRVFEDHPLRMESRVDGILDGVDDDSADGQG